MVVYQRNDSLRTTCKDNQQEFVVDNDFLRYHFIYPHCLGGVPFAWLPPLHCLFESNGQKPLGKFGKFIAASGFQEKGITMKSLQEYTRWKKDMAPYGKSDLRKSVWQLVNSIVPFILLWGFAYASMTSLSGSHWR